MSKKIGAEIRKCLSYWKSHPAMALVAIFPPLLLGLLFVGAFRTTGVANLVMVNGDPGAPWTERFMEVLERREGTIPYFNLILAEENEAARMFEMHETFGLLHVPPGFGKSIEEGRPVPVTAIFTAIHEDISKNVRLGAEARIYDFVKLYDLDRGKRPGLVVEAILESAPLPRSDYMMAGIMIWSMVYLGLFIGGVLGASEKEEGTDRYIKMAAHGELLSAAGKWIATAILSLIMITLLILLFIIFFGLVIPGWSNIIHILLLFLGINAVFSFPGILYGRRAGDFRLVPAPMIIFSLTLWLCSGALNPLTFSAGSAFFKYLPTSAGIRLLSFSLFERGGQSVGESTAILAAWTAAALIFTGTWFYCKNKKTSA